MKKLASRRGLHILEIAIAIGLMAGPLVIGVHLIASNSRGARHDAERATAQFVLTDTLELLRYEPSSVLRRANGPGGAGELRDLVRRCAGALSEETRKAELRHTGPLLDRMTFKLEEGVGGVAGLSRFTLQVKLENQQPVTLTALVRLDARG